ncbi:MAG TPA: hypothetical protein VLG50_07715 [Candidatus Saccharimonadales bacterium]|nr:hypothetical protein [Candidatus Saccharimonadales bacterium]
MDRSSMIQHDDYVSFIFNGTEKQAAQHRQQFMTQLECHAIHRVHFIKNTTQFTNEHISHRLAFLVIDNNQHSIGRLYLNGPTMVISQHITGLQCKYDNVPLFYLDEGEEIHCELETERGTGHRHQKWNAVAAITYNNIDTNRWQFEFELTGRLTLDEILQQI